ncbi:uncharacterized protein LOC131952059 [Physella acuta]|uniref:uncharacterized protein LOC131952059 n=1 Tax=Physella acuta TaxID=109671 RepID=UPI0027DBA541|nr:uncharacterized protein LOC131952059 [Physella acuta]
MSAVFKNTVTCGVTTEPGTQGFLSYDYIEGSECSFEIEKDPGSGKGIGVFKYTNKFGQYGKANQSLPFPFDEIKVVNQKYVEKKGQKAYVVEVKKTKTLDLNDYFS